MDYQTLYAKTVAELRKLAREMQVRLPAGAKKQLMVDLLAEDFARREAEQKEAAGARTAGKRPARTQRAAKDAAKDGEKDGAKDAAKEPDPLEPPAQRRRGRPRKAEQAAPPAPEAGAAEPPKENRVSGNGVQEPKATPKPSAGEAAREVAPPAKPVARENAPSAPSAPPDRPAAPAKPAEVSTKPVEVSVKPVEVSAKPAEAPEARLPGRPVQRGFGRRDARVGGQDAQAPIRRGNAGPMRQGTNRYVPYGAEVRPAAPRQRPGANHPRQEGQEVRPYAPPRQEVQEPQAVPAPAAPSAPRPEAAAQAEYRAAKPAVPELLATGECGEGAGVLEIQPDGYGFLRAENCQQGPNDVYISIAQIRRFNLRMGDFVEGRTRPQREGDRYSAILYITKVNGEDPEKAAMRARFEDLVPIYPNQRLRLEQAGSRDLSLRLVDMLAPIGKGQRGMIVSPPKAGKTTLLKKIANAITARYPDIHLIVLLIDERPEEVTDMKRSIDGEVVYSTFDEMPENHTRVSEMVLERAQRLVEMGRDVVVLMDSITRLARAYNLVIAPTGRSLSGGLDPGALFKPKRFFGAARNIENGGSLTVIATALVETGSRMDDIIYEEFKGTGNMELHLDRKLSDRRVFPAIDMVRSGTRREELLLSEEEQAGALQVRRILGNGRDQEMTEQIIGLMTRTRDNADFFQRLKGWAAVAEKEGYTLGR